jgi:hypothetical protein
MVRMTPAVLQHRDLGGVGQGVGQPGLCVGGDHRQRQRDAGGEAQQIGELRGRRHRVVVAPP